MTKPSEMPGWPEYPVGLTDLGKALGQTPVAVYERARADAWEARCRVAVEALQTALDEECNDPWRVMRTALSTIGDLKFSKELVLENT